MMHLCQRLVLKVLEIEQEKEISVVLLKAYHLSVCTNRNCAVTISAECITGKKVSTVDVIAH